MDMLRSFIPVDRRHALARGEPLPTSVAGAALFADISGFTPLAGALAAAHGRQRGAEELTALLNQVYGALTDEIDRYGGAVVGFSGDGVLCWFDGDDGLRAATCAMRLQEAMRAFGQVPVGDVTAELGVKVAVGVGTARRLLVGDPAVQRKELLAGALVDQLAAGEQLAGRGEVLLTAAAAARLGARALVRAQRDDGQGGRFAVLGGLAEEAAPAPWPELPEHLIPDDVARGWLLPNVYERLRGGHGLFLSDLRPAVALFLAFGQLDYEGDPGAAALLDSYVRWAQAVLERHGGALIDVTLGDKGSYLYAAFGAPLAHADDALRAAGAAVELRRPPPALARFASPRAGLVGGTVRSGDYGGSTRTYAALGDPVNLAARLMQAAAPGQILAALSLAPQLERRFVLLPQPPLTVKGRAAPLDVALVVGERAAPLELLEDARYALPIVGRAAERGALAEALDRAIAGQGGAVGVAGSAGLGKSRLVAELVRAASEAGLAVLLGEALPHGASVSYLAWRAPLRALYGLAADSPAPEQAAQLARSLDALGPGLAARAPLLAPLLGLPLADNDLTRGLEPRARREAAEALVADSLRARAARTPVLLVVEDAHWLDQPSVDLLALVARAAAGSPLLALLSYRPREDVGGPDLAASVPGLREVRLGELGPAEVTELIRLKVAGLYGAGAQAAPALAERVAQLAQGNPFYLEELLNYLRDLGVAPGDSAEALELPASLSQLLLSRVDRLTADEQTTLKVASIIGRQFPATWLRGVHPELGTQERVQRNLDMLARLELTPLLSSEPELRYLFKHVITQEVVYESLPYGLRARLHERLAAWLELQSPGAPPLDLLAFHYGRTENRDKQREYFRRAGDAAAASFANAAAIGYYARLLPLVEGAERAAAELELGLARALAGDWDAAERHYLSVAGADLPRPSAVRARAGLARGELHWSRGRYAEAGEALAAARAEFAELGDGAGLVQALTESAAMLRVQGRHDEALAALREARGHAERAGDSRGLGRVLHITANVLSTTGEQAAAQALYRQAIALRQEAGDRYGLASTLNNLGLTMLIGGDAEAALPIVRQAHDSFREIGVRRTASISRMTLGRIYTALGQPDHACELFRASIAEFDLLGATWELGTAAVGLAGAVWRRDGGLAGLELAARICGAADALIGEVGAALQANDRATVAEVMGAARERLGPEVAEAVFAGGRALGPRERVALLLEAGG